MTTRGQPRTAVPRLASLHNRVCRGLRLFFIKVVRSTVQLEIIGAKFVDVVNGRYMFEVPYDYRE